MAWKSLLAASALSIFSASNASAASFHLVRLWDNEAYFIDASTIQRHGDIVDAWMTRVLRRTDEKLKSDYTVQHFVFDCSAHKINLIGWWNYNLKGNVVEHHDLATSAFTSMPPDSVGWQAADMACSNFVHSPGQAEATTSEALTVGVRELWRAW